jgi:hypothetical protein
MVWYNMNLCTPPRWPLWCLKAWVVKAAHSSGILKATTRYIASIKRNADFDQHDMLTRQGQYSLDVIRRVLQLCHRIPRKNEEPLLAFEYLAENSSRATSTFLSSNQDLVKGQIIKPFVIALAHLETHSISPEMLATLAKCLDKDAGAKNVYAVVDVSPYFDQLVGILVRCLSQPRFEQQAGELLCCIGNIPKHKLMTICTVVEHMRDISSTSHWLAVSREVSKISRERVLLMRCDEQTEQRATTIVRLQAIIDEHEEDDLIVGAASQLLLCICTMVYDGPTVQLSQRLRDRLVRTLKAPEGRLVEMMFHRDQLLLQAYTMVQDSNLACLPETGTDTNWTSAEGTYGQIPSWSSVELVQPYWVPNFARA